MNEEIHYRPIHRCVLIVYVITTPATAPAAGEWTGRWAAYCVPVPGQNHTKEAEAWRDAGTKIGETEARAFWPALVADLDERIKWNP